ncbi:MAG: hypothetical protein J1G04_02205 [Clostridiales bacterium]|nr:hypothetical protein [Clostridiales bacterium]
MKITKKIIVLIAALFCAFGLFACGTEAVGNDEPQMVEFEHITVDADTVNEIKTAFYGEDSDYYTSSKWGLEIYGEYNGAYAFYATDAASAAVVSCEVVDGLIFTYSCGMPMLVYSDGNIMRLQEAYDSGILSYDDLIDLSEKHEGGLFYYTDESDIEGYHKI